MPLKSNVSHRMSTPSDARQVHEQLVFAEFAQAVPLPRDAIAPSSRLPPEPDLFVRLNGNPCYFELGRLADDGWAKFMLEVQRRAPTPVTPKYDEIGYPQRDMLRQKLSKSYQSFGHPPMNRFWRHCAVRAHGHRRASVTSSARAARPASLAASTRPPVFQAFCAPALPGEVSRAALCKLACKESHMATNLAIDPELLDRAVEVSGERTKKAVVTKALQEFIARRQQKRVVELMGKLEWDDSFNYKAERSRS